MGLLSDMDEGFEDEAPATMSKPPEHDENTDPIIWADQVEAGQIIQKMGTSDDTRYRVLMSRKNEAYDIMILVCERKASRLTDELLKIVVRLDRSEPVIVRTKF